MQKGHLSRSGRVVCTATMPFHVRYPSTRTHNPACLNGHFSIRVFLISTISGPGDSSPLQPLFSPPTTDNDAKCKLAKLNHSLFTLERQMELIEVRPRKWKNREGKQATIFLERVYSSVLCLGGRPSVTDGITWTSDQNLSS